MRGGGAWAAVPRLERPRGPFLLLLLLLLVLLVMSAGLAWLVGSTFQQDLAAYYTAGASMSVGLDPYRNYRLLGGPWDGLAMFQHSRFLYPPLMGEIFRPLAALPYPVAKALFSAVSAVALLVALALLPRGARTGRHRQEVRSLAVSHAAQAKWKWKWPLLVLGSVVLWPPVFLALERGQIDLLLLAALAAAWRFRDRPVIAGPLLGIAIVAKPLLLAALLFVVAARQYRWAAATAGTLVLLGVLNVAMAGGAVSEKYLFEVLPRAALYGEGGTEEMLLPEAAPAALSAGSGDGEEALARINGVGRGYAQELGSFPRNASLPRLVAGGAPPSPLLGALLFVVLALPLARGARRAPQDPSWYWGALLAAVVAAPVAWAMELVWALPLFWLLGTAERFQHLLKRGHRGWWPCLLGAAWLTGLAGPFVPAAWSIAALLLVAAAVARLRVSPREPRP